MPAPAFFQGPDGRFLKGAHWRQPAVFRERDYLLHEYVAAGRSMREIGDEHGVSEEAIKHWLVKHDIPRRTISQARALKYWGVFGSANPMFGRTGPANPRFVDGSSPERQSAYASSTGRAWRRNALKRDGYRCLRCGNDNPAPRNLHVHHPKPWAGNPAFRFDLDNSATLCRACHQWVHSRANVGGDFLR